MPRIKIKGKVVKLPYTKGGIRAYKRIKAKQEKINQTKKRRSKRSYGVMNGY